jgi:hypothetical protein
MGAGANQNARIAGMPPRPMPVPMQGQGMLGQRAPQQESNYIGEQTASLGNQPKTQQSMLEAQPPMGG